MIYIILLQFNLHNKFKNLLLFVALVVAIKIPLQMSDLIQMQ